MLNSAIGNREHDSSFNSSLGRLTQEAFSELQPKAESSPKRLVAGQDSEKIVPSMKTWMDRKITINVSVYSVLLVLSVAVNVALTVYYLY